MSLDRTDVTAQAQEIAQGAMRRSIDVGPIAAFHASLLNKLGYTDPDMVQSFMKSPDLVDGLVEAEEQINIFKQLEQVGVMTSADFQIRINEVLRNVTEERRAKIIATLESDFVEKAVEEEMKASGIDPYETRFGKQEEYRREAMEYQAIDMVRAHMKKAAE